MALTLTYLAETAVPVELLGVTPDRIGQSTRSEIERLDVLQGNRRVPLAELFRVSGNAPADRILLEGDLSGVSHIGRGMIAGEIRIDGHAGRHVGAGMRGGEIRVDGNAGDWLGAEMTGGLIRVSGSVGDSVGSAYPGSKLGMTDGTILIEGSAGQHVGRSMRRGLVAVGGACGALPGFAMVAGTILVFGPCGEYPGADMRRGTIGLFGPDPPRLLPTFRRAGRFRPLFLGLIARELRRLVYRAAEGLSPAELSLYHGDLLALGKGEVWVRDSGHSA